MIKNIITVNDNPAIVQVEFEPFLPDEKLDKIYQEVDSFKEINYNDELTQKANRFAYRGKSKVAEKFAYNISLCFKEITKHIIKLDPVNYPIYYGKAKSKDKMLDQWYEEQQLWKKRHGLLILDKPGFSQGFHIDNRFVLWAGIINLQDNSATTEHYRKTGEYDYELYYKSTGKKWFGTFWLNTEHTWHMLPEVTEDRRIVLCNQWQCATALDPK